MGQPVRFASQCKVCGIPVVAIAQGADPAVNETRGHAKGIIAIGDIATGVLAIGGVARGLVAIGGVAAGLITIAGVGFGALVIAGVAIAQTAYGGVAIGQYAKGGATVGAHVISPTRVDDQAINWFVRLGLHPPKRPESWSD